MDAHAMDPLRVLASARAMGARWNRLLVVGCEPSPCAPEGDMAMELSEPVAAAVEEAITLIESHVTRLLAQPAAAARVSALATGTASAAAG